MRTKAKKTTHPLQGVRAFFQRREKVARPILVAFSGGADSMALVQSLDALGIPFALAHFDHQWRKESGEEAKRLEAWAEEREVSFHLGVGEAKTEDGARNERFAFLKDLYESGSFESIALAHHSDDQGETVLKRVLEGASLRAMKGMREVDEREGVLLWRPLLSTRKKEILASLEDGTYLIDPTNFDGSNLRSRMRIKLIPQITESFGKEIDTALTRLGRRMEELDAYMERRCEKFVGIRDGDCWNFSQHIPLDPFEVSYFLRREWGHPPDEILERLVAALCDGEVNIHGGFGGHLFTVNRYRISLERNPFDGLC